MFACVWHHVFTRGTTFFHAQNNMFRMSCPDTYVDSLAYVSIGRDAGAYDKCAILAQESTWFKAQTVLICLLPVSSSELGGLQRVVDGT